MLFKMFLVLNICIGVYTILIYRFGGADPKMRKIISRQGRAEKNMTSLLLPLSVEISKRIKFSEAKRTNLVDKLAAAHIDLSPEMYYANAISTSAVYAIGIGLFSLVYPVLLFVALLFAAINYRTNISAADKAISLKRDAIDNEATHFVAFSKEFIKSNTDIKALLENYSLICGNEFASEILVTIADMKTSSYDDALMQFDKRINSAYINQIISGLLGVVKGENEQIYFDILHHDLVKSEKERIRKAAQTMPLKLKPYLVMILLSFAATYIYVMLYEAVGNATVLFK